MSLNSKNLKLIAAAVILCAVTVAAVFLPVAQWVNAFAEWIRTLGVAGVFLFVVVFVAAALISLPASVFAAAAGLIYGFGGGAVVAITGAICASTLGFLLARHVFRERVEGYAKTHRKFAAIDRALGEQGWKIVGLLRLSPVMPLGLSTYLFGVTSIEFAPYALTSALGVIPGTLMYVYLGAVGRIGLSGAKHQRSPLEWGLMLAGLVATVAVTLLVGRIAKSALDKTAPAVA